MHRLHPTKHRHQILILPGTFRKFPKIPVSNIHPNIPIYQQDNYSSDTHLLENAKRVFDFNFLDFGQLIDCYALQ